jgi:hypothetical protein
MITNVGTGILTKYLLGQTISYASHLAIGCGATPLDSGDEVGDYSAKTSLDFEMLRVPIISRGYVIEEGVQQIVFTGEMPTDSRYEISEVGVFPASENPSAQSSKSKTLFTFDENSSERWLINSSLEIPSITTALDTDGNGNIATTETVFRANSTNPVFENIKRLTAFKNETPRFLDSSIFISGDSSELPSSNDAAVKAYEPVEEDTFISYDTNGISLKNYGPTDKVKIAISVINKTSDAPDYVAPDKIAVLIKFKTADPSQYATLGKVVVSGAGWNPGDSRYLVIEEEVQNIAKQSGFSWDNVNSVEIYVAAFLDDEVSGNYLIALDGVRIENTSSLSPVYGLVGYSVIKNDTGSTVKKKANSSTLVEFRFAVDVQ